MLSARQLDAHYQQYNKTIHKIILEDIPLLLPKFEEPRRHKREIVGILFKAVVGIALWAFLAFVRQSKRKALFKALLAMR